MRKGESGSATKSAAKGGCCAAQGELKKSRECLTIKRVRLRKKRPLPSREGHSEGGGGSRLRAKTLSIVSSRLPQIKTTKRREEGKGTNRLRRRFSSVLQDSVKRSEGQNRLRENGNEHERGKREGAVERGGKARRKEKKTSPLLVAEKENRSRKKDEKITLRGGTWGLFSSLEKHNNGEERR